MIGRARTEKVPVMALRRHDDGTDTMDDVVVQDVQVFRAEQLGHEYLWLACYFRNGERVTFHVYAKDGLLEYDVGEMPDKWIDWDKQR